MKNHPERVCLRVCVCSYRRTMRTQRKEEHGGLFPVLWSGVVALDKCTCIVTNDFITAVTLDAFQGSFFLIGMSRKELFCG